VADEARAGPPRELQAREGDGGELGKVACAGTVGCCSWSPTAVGGQLRGTRLGGALLVYCYVGDQSPMSFASSSMSAICAGLSWAVLQLFSLDLPE
jgi:hypothetical protein